MKKNWIKVKWAASKVRPFILPLSLTIVLGAVCSLSGIILALISKQLIDCATTAQVHKIIQYVLIICLVFLTDVGSRTAASVISSRNSTQISNKIQQSIYSRLTQTDWLDLSRYHSGDVITRITSDVDAVTNLFASILPNIVSLCVMLTGALITILVFEPFLAVLALLPGPVTLLSSRFFGSKLKKIYIQMQETEACCRSFLQESIRNIIIVKAFCLERKSIDTFNALQNKKLLFATRRSLIGAVSNSVLSFSSWFGYFLVFIWGALNLSKGVTEFGIFAVFLQLVSHIQGPFSGIVHTFPQVVSAFASAERLMELENLKLDKYNSPVADISPAGIQFESVEFSYKKNIPILKNVSVTICPGEIAALVGSSGEGKTTFIRLLLSLIEPEKGHVYITNSHQRFEVSACSRKLISYVPQENTLFSGTIADNLRYGCPHATDDELKTAARAACLWEFVESLPNGLYTVIGEHGTGLSEGQAQRLAIARALLHNSPILLLDEATSALDINTEIKILQTIRSLSPARTCIIITHRLTALKICNRVFKLENSHMIEVNNQTIDNLTIEAV